MSRRTSEGHAAMAGIADGVTAAVGGSKTGGDGFFQYIMVVEDDVDATDLTEALHAAMAKTHLERRPSRFTIGSVRVGTSQTTLDGVEFGTVAACKYMDYRQETPSYRILTCTTKFIRADRRLLSTRRRLSKWVATPATSGGCPLNPPIPIV